LRENFDRSDDSFARTSATRTGASVVLVSVTVTGNRPSSQRNDAGVSISMATGRRPPASPCPEIP
jgi:hypothetical protein